MHQRFVLPNNCGTLQSVSYVNVKPQFQQEVADGHVVLTGIYLIQVELEVGEGEPACATDGVFIDEVDLEGNVVYFEYGLPLSRMLAGEALVVDYQMEQIEGVILPDGALEIKAQENISRKPEAIQAVAQSVSPVNTVEALLKEAVTEPVAQLQPKQTADWIHESKSATGIVEWLSLSNHYKTEKIQLNPILKQRVANQTEDEQ